MSKMRLMGWSSAGSKEPPRVFEVDVPVPGPGNVPCVQAWSARADEERCARICLQEHPHQRGVPWNH